MPSCAGSTAERPCARPWPGTSGPTCSAPTARSRARHWPRGSSPTRKPGAGSSSLLHPLVAEALERWRSEQEKARPGAVLVHEVPLLFEAGLADRYDLVVLITAPDALRRARVPERYDERSAAQLPEADKIVHADRVYVNDGTPAELERWVAELVADLQAA